MMTVKPVRFWAGFAILFLLYQSAEGVGARLMGSFAVQAGLMVLCVAAAWPVGRYVLGRRGWDAYALERQAGALRWLVAGLLLSFVAKAIALAAGVRIGAYSFGPAPSSPGAAGIAAAVAFAAVSTLIASAAEDIVTRGIWWRARIFAGAGTFVAASSLIYLLNHIYRLGNGPVEWAMLVCFGIAYAMALARTGTLWAAVGVHWGWNLANALLDSFATIAGNPALTPWLSASVHLLIAIAIFLSTKGWAAQHAPANAQAERTR